MSYEEEPSLRRLSILLNNKRGSALKTSIDGLLGVAVNGLQEFQVKPLLEGDWGRGWGGTLFSVVICHAIFLS